MTHHEPIKMSYKLLQQITNNFDKERIIGRGAFGTVYKGVHVNHGEISVKVLHNFVGLDDTMLQTEFHNLRGLNHPNIAKLVGFCYELVEEPALFEGKQVIAGRAHRALCFEYLHNGSLDKHISDETTGLTWQARYKLIKGICQGLKYLREALEYPIMHFDINPDNILLDKYMVPKISNFGVSRLFCEEDERRTVSCVGTLGYVPPEFIQHQIISKQFDIFSLGVTILRIMVGRELYFRSEEMETRKFAKLVHEIWRKRLCQSNTQLLELYCYQVIRCTDIALDCLESNRLERPTISDIISNLSETEKMIGEHELQIEQVYQDDSREPVFPYKHRITSRPSSGHAEVRCSSQNCNSLWATTEPKVMAFKDLHRITNGFSEECLLGMGGYGKVYEGVLNGEKVAVKKLHNNPVLVGKQFENELLNLARLQHPNIIRLVGYSSETRESVVKYDGKYVIATLEERALCLEYMPGTLDEHISDESGGLHWNTRLKIIKGICKGLKYLHTGSKYPICHMDLKPSNILLDKDMIPKIGDFGLSKLIDTTKTCVAEKAIGTSGYMPPEYIDGQQFSPKFDMFSLGVIIIELIAGRNAYKNYKSNFMPSQEFIDQVTSNWRRREQAEPMSTDAFLEVEKCIEMALLCVEDNRENRPTITKVVEDLNMIDLRPA